MVRQSRRRFLGSIAAGGTAALAGCNGLLGDDSGSDDSASTEWATWVPAEFVGVESEGQVSRIDVDRFEEQFPQEVRSELDVSRIESEYGLSDGALDQIITVEQSPSEDHTVYLGDVDPDAVVEELEYESTTTDEGYEVVLGQVAIDDGVIVSSRSYETVFAAHAGEVTRLAEQGGEWGPAVENASGGAIGTVETAPEHPWELQAFEATGDGDGSMEITAYAHFSSAEAAASNKEAVRAEVASNTDEDEDSYEVQSVTVDGNVVVLEWTTTDVSF